MRPALLAFALMISTALPAFAQILDGLSPSALTGPSLTERLWQRTDHPDLPGAMVLFLSDGTMLRDSCWETYRIDQWRMTGEDTLSFDEDTMTIDATIVTLDEASLVLELALVGGETVTHTYEPAPVPYLCPSMP